jgi:transcriptional regulator with XRE-family HTH domain
MSSWAGNLIRIARRDTGLSQRELARRAGTSQATLSAYEAGRKAPSLDTLARIIRAAGLDLRIQLERYDDHDDVMAAYEASLPERVRKARRRRDLTAINKARRARGLDPVTADDLVGAGKGG